MKSSMTLIVAFLASLWLSGCSVFDEIEVECEFDGDGLRQCTIGTKSAFPSPKTGPQLAQILNPNQTLLSFNGTTVGLPSGGFLTLTAHDANGAVISAISGSWDLSSNAAVPGNPGAIDSWVYSLPSGVYELRTQLHAFTVMPQPGLNTVSVSLEQGGTSYGSASETFYYSGCNTSDLPSATACIE